MVALLRRCVRHVRMLHGLAVLSVLALPAFAGTDLDLVAPGTPGADLRKALGTPVATADRDGTRSEDYARHDAGLEHVTVWLDEHDKVAWGRVVLVNELDPKTATLLFNILGSASRSEGHAFAEHAGGHCLHYASDGVHFFVVQGHVAEIWRTKRNADLVAIRKASATTWPPPVPKASEGVGTRERLDEDNDGETPGPPPALLRMIGVGPATAQLALDDQSRPVLKITGPVDVHGFKGKDVRFEGWLSPADLSGVLRAAKDAPAAFNGPGGSFRPIFRGKVLYDRAGWKAATLDYPLTHVQGGLKLRGRFVVSLEVVCEDLAGYANAVVDIPGGSYRPESPIPTMEMSPFGVVHAQHEKLGPGICIMTPIRVRNARDQSMTGYATLWRPGRQQVLAAEGWDAWRGKQGEFYSADTVKVAQADASWESFQLFLPFSALALEPGTQKVIVRVQFAVPPLGAARELEIEITVPKR